LGRPEARNTTIAVQAKKAGGLSQSNVAKELGISIATVKRHWNNRTLITRVTYYFCSKVSQPRNERIFLSSLIDLFIVIQIWI
jgi:DNA invertase Pin-like site-specific DNA recombinase